MLFFYFNESFPLTKKICCVTMVKPAWEAGKKSMCLRHLPHVLKWKSLSEGILHIYAGEESAVLLCSSFFHLNAFIKFSKKANPIHKSRPKGAAAVNLTTKKKKQKREKRKGGHRYETDASLY